MNPIASAFSLFIGYLWLRCVAFPREDEGDRTNFSNFAQYSNERLCVTFYSGFATFRNVIREYFTDACFMDRTAFIRIDVHVFVDGRRTTIGVINGRRKFWLSKQPLYTSNVMASFFFSAQAGCPIEDVKFVEVRCTSFVEAFKNFIARCPSGTSNGREIHTPAVPGIARSNATSLVMRNVRRFNERGCFVTINGAYRSNRVDKVVINIRVVRVNPEICRITFLWFVMFNRWEVRVVVPSSFITVAPGGSKEVICVTFCRFFSWFEACF